MNVNARYQLQWEQEKGSDRDQRMMERREAFVRATRKCISQRGVSRTTIADITRELGITRELFYYYFETKNAAVVKALETYVADARTLLVMELKTVEDEHRSTAWGTRFDALVAVMRALRTWLKTDEDAALPMIAVLNEVSLWPKMLYTVANESVKALIACEYVSKSGASDGGPGLARILAVVGALDAMLYNPKLKDDEIAASIMPLFN